MGQNSLRIAIEASCWSNRRGYGRFTRELIAALIAEYGKTHEFCLICDSKTALDGGLPKGARVEAVSLSQRPTDGATAEGARSVRDMLRMGRAFGRVSPDVVFFPTPFTYVPALTRAPVVLCVHDAMTERHPEHFFPTRRNHLNWQAKLWLARRQASRLITPTRQSGEDIAQAFRLSPDALTPIGEAAAQSFAPVTQPDRLETVARRHDLDPTRPLLLYVGGVSPHKNLETLISALKQVRSPWQFAIVGDIENDRYLSSAEQLRAGISNLGMQDRVRLTGFVDDSDLAALYSLARCLVLPSLDEGFGLPVVEAMACGTPAVLSRRGALPEVGGDAAIYFDPLNEQQMAQTIDRMLCDDVLHGTLAQNALARVALFSWTAVADRTMTVLQDAAASTFNASPKNEIRKRHDVTARPS